MEEKIEFLKKSIIEEAPQVPFVIDQIGHAIDWCIKAHDEGDIVKILEISLDVARYAKQTSDPNFYKTHLVIASLIADIEDATEDSNFQMYKTASNIVETTVKQLKVPKELIEQRGHFNALNIHLTQLARVNGEYFLIALYSILHDLKDIVGGMKQVGVKSPITPQNYITILGYAYVIANLRMANLSLLDAARAVMNEISIILNNDVIY